MVGPARHRQRGFSVAEVAIAFSVITILLTAALGGVRAHQVNVAREMVAFEASCAASNRIELLRAGRADLALGPRTFEPSMKGAVGHEVLEAIEPGLVRVRVTVRVPAADVHVSLESLVARRTTP